MNPIRLARLSLPFCVMVLFWAQPLPADGVPAPPAGLFTLTDEGDRSGYLGVRLEEETEHAEGGARVTAVIGDSPADEAGLEEGDIVVRFDGQTIRGPVALTRRIHEHEPGDRIRIRIVRDGQPEDLQVELGRRSTLFTVWPDAPDVAIGLDQLDESAREEVDRQLAKLRHLGPLGSWPRVEGDAPAAPPSWFVEEAFGRPKLGVQLIETTPELRVHLGSDEASGVLVSKILAAMPAERSGVRVGDLIVSIGDEPIAEAADIRRALRGADGKTVDVEVIRDGERLTLRVEIPSRERDRPTGPRAALVPAGPPAPPLARSAPAPAPAPAPRPLDALVSF